MYKFLKVNSPALPNEAHVSYNEALAAFFEENDPKKLEYDAEYQAFQRAFAKEVDLLDQVRKSEYTKQIHEQDQFRDMLVTGLHNAVKTALCHFDPTFRKAAASLDLVFDSYGNIADRPLNKETAAIDDIIRELDGKYSTEMSKLQLGEWTKQLSAANAAFKALMKSRFEESGAKPDTTMRIARLATDKYLRELLYRIDVMAEANGIARYDKLIHDVNATTEYYKNQLAQAAGKRHAKSDDK